MYYIPVDKSEVMRIKTNTFSKYNELNCLTYKLQNVDG